MIERQLIGRFETASGRKTARDASQGHRFSFEKIDQVICGGFAFGIGSKRKNDFGKFFLLDPIKQFVDAQIFRTDMIERRNFAA